MCCPTFVCLLLLTRYSSKRGCKRQELIGEGAENRHLSLLLFSALWISHGCNSVHSIEPSLVLHREGGGEKKRWEKDGEVSWRVRRDERITGNKWRRSVGDEWLETGARIFTTWKLRQCKNPKTKQFFWQSVKQYLHYNTPTDVFWLYKKWYKCKCNLINGLRLFVLFCLFFNEHALIINQRQRDSKPQFSVSTKHQSHFFIICRTKTQ